MESDVARLLTWDAPDDAAARDARVRAHPRYAAAVRRFAANVLEAGDADRLLDGLLKDSGRNAAALATAYLHFSGGLTLPRLKGLVAQLGSSSPGRARALLIYLGYVGYVELLSTPQRGAPALYRPTPRFLATWRNHQRIVLDAAQVLEPGVGALLARFDAPGVFEAYTREICEALLEEARDFDMDQPHFRVFLHHMGGIQITHALVDASPGEAFPPNGPIPFAVAAAARRFRVSRPQVRRILEAAARERLMQLGEDGTVSFTPEGGEVCAGFLATQMRLFLVAAARTCKARPELVAGPQRRAG